MTILDDDMEAIHAEALGLGLATSVTYTTVAGVSSTVTVSLSESAEPFLYDEGGEKRRRTVLVSIATASIAAPAKGDRFTVSSGTYAGTWTIVELGTGDPASWILTARLDDRTTVGVGRRLP